MSRRGRKRFKGTTIVLNSEKIFLFFSVFLVFLLSFYITRTNLLSARVNTYAIGLSVSGFKAEILKPLEKENFLNHYSVISKIIPSFKANEEMRKKYAVMFEGSIKAKKEAKKAKEEAVLKGNVKEVNSPGKLSFNNATDYFVDANSLLSEGFSINNNLNEPKVLIISTHSSEAYSESAGGRSEDENKNVLRVGAELAKTLNKNGIKTIHDKTRNDYPSYNGSYKKALSVIEENLKKNPSIEVVIDVHRDYMETAEGVRLKPTAEVKGKKAAQIMFVVGTDFLGLEHPLWRENLKLAVKTQDILNKTAPSLCRSINIRTERFNQHMTKGSLIVEFGSSENTLDEAVLSASLLGEALAESLKN